MSEKTSVEDWLAIRKEEGRKIDPSTAEWGLCYAQVVDPYDVYSEIPEECDCIGREYFARRPGSEIWVAFSDLSEETRSTYRTGRSSSCPFLLGVHARDWRARPWARRKKGKISKAKRARAEMAHARKPLKINQRNQTRWPEVAPVQGQVEKRAGSGRQNVNWPKWRRSTQRLPCSPSLTSQVGTVPHPLEFPPP